MADLISRALALEVISAVKGITWSQSGKVLCGKMYSQIKDLPAVDATPVVRCKECRYWREEVSPTEHWVCAHHSFNERKMYTTPNFYCADGERRNEDAAN